MIGEYKDTCSFIYHSFNDKFGYIKSSGIYYLEYLDDWNTNKNVIDLVLERKNDDGTIHFFIIKDAKEKGYTVDDFENAPELTEDDYIFGYIQKHCKRFYQKTIEELSIPSIPALQKKIAALENRIAQLEEYADAIDMVAELINDVFPE